MKRIIITGVGGAAGISILLSLKRSNDYYLIGVDADQYASGQIIASTFHVVPKANDPLFLPSLLNISQGCDALFCTVDEEIPIVSRAKKAFSCKIFLSEPQAVEACLNKLKSAELMKDNDIPIPQTWPYEKRLLAVKKAGFPLIVKPVVGRGGKDVFQVSNVRALNAIGHLIEKKLLVQEYLSEPEYTVDVLADEQSQLRKIVARERIRVKNGVATVSRVVDPQQFIVTVKRILATFGLKYIFMVQFRANPVRVIEIGPRPAGTLILSTESNANMPIMLLEDAYDENLTVQYQPDVWYYRLNQGIVFKGSVATTVSNQDLHLKVNLL